MIVDEHLKVALMTARGLLRSASEHVDAVERHVQSGDLNTALSAIHTGAARRSRDAFEQLASAAGRLEELGATHTPADAD